MLKKLHRLREREVQKVLRKGKPFFSYTLVFNVCPNTIGISRFAIVIGGKSVANSVIRNNYRRAFYTICGQYIQTGHYDIVCIVKKKTKLGDDEASKEKFIKELRYLFEQKLGKNF